MFYIKVLTFLYFIIFSNFNISGAYYDYYNNYDNHYNYHHNYNE